MRFKRVAQAGRSNTVSCGDDSKRTYWQRRQEPALATPNSEHASDRTYDGVESQT